MRYIQKDIIGYATTYKSAKQYSTTYPWANVNKAFDWDSSIVPNSSGTSSSTDWWNTYASVKVYYSTSSSYKRKWYLDGIGTYKSYLNDNFDDAYGTEGTEYTNFSCIPDDSELVKFTFISRSSLAKYHNEEIKYFKGTTDVTAYGSSSISTTYCVYKTAKSSGISVTEVMNYNNLTQIGHIFTKSGSNWAYSHLSGYNIGPWTLSDFKNGKFLPRVYYTSNSISASTTAYDYPRGFALKLTVKIPAYTISTRASDANGGSVVGGGEYFSGKTASLKAIPNAGYKFIGWEDENGNFFWDEPNFNLLINKDMNLVAVFKQDKINNININVSKFSKSYINTSEVKSIYIDDIKVYG